MCISLFYKLDHPLPHGPISNATQSVPLFTLPTIPCIAKGVKLACIVNKSKLVH